MFSLKTRLHLSISLIPSRQTKRWVCLSGIHSSDDLTMISAGMCDVNICSLLLLDDCISKAIYYNRVYWPSLMAAASLFINISYHYRYIFYRYLPVHTALSFINALYTSTFLSQKLAQIWISAAKVEWIIGQWCLRCVVFHYSVTCWCPDLMEFRNLARNGRLNLCVRIFGYDVTKPDIINCQANELPLQVHWSDSLHVNPVFWGPSI